MYLHAFIKDIQQLALEFVRNVHSDSELCPSYLCLPRDPLSTAMKINALTYELEGLGSVEKLGAAWTDLESRSDCSFFLTWDWVGTWLRTIPGLTPLVLSVRDGTTLVGLALLQPARLRHKFLKKNALLLHQTGDGRKDALTIEYNGILCDRQHIRSIKRALFAFLTAESTPAGNWDELHVALATDPIAGDAEAAGLISFELARKPSWLVDLDSLRLSGTPYLHTVGPNTRQQIRRSTRLYERRGVIKSTSAATLSEADESFTELKLHHQDTWAKRGRRGSFASPYFEPFHRILIQRCLKRGAVELVRISAGVQLIGIFYNFIHRGHVYAYQTGLSYESDHKLKPGLVGHSLCVERHLGTGASVYDFMAGEARYKANLGTPGPDLMHFMFQRPTLLRRGLSVLRKWRHHL